MTNDRVRQKDVCGRTGSKDESNISQNARDCEKTVQMMAVALHVCTNDGEDGMM